VQPAEGVLRVGHLDRIGRVKLSAQIQGDSLLLVALQHQAAVTREQRAVCAVWVLLAKPRENAARKDRLLPSEVREAPLVELTGSVGHASGGGKQRKSSEQ
jgi:hypothetical protein